MEERFLRQAIDVASDKARSNKYGPFGAVIVKDGEVVSEGWNQVVELCDPSAHAEIAAIRSACAALQSHRLDGCEIYCSCEPCAMCTAAIYWARIEAVYYACSASDAAAAGFDDALIGEELALPPGGRSIRMVQCCRDAGLEAFTKWVSNPHKTPY